MSYCYARIIKTLKKSFMKEIEGIRKLSVPQSAGTRVYKFDEEEDTSLIEEE